MSGLLEFRIWGAVPDCDAVSRLTADPLVQRILLAVRNVSKTASQIADEIRAHREAVRVALAGLQARHLVARPNLRGTILELKFTDRFPDWMGDLVRAFDLQRTSVSKYCLCIDEMAVRPGELY